jgi:NAD(P)-dependent dehydrogenase (short-subunit alcohol dehydrogenase family)
LVESGSRSTENVQKHGKIESMELQSHSALVTGGAKRIGRAISLRLASAGYAVAIHCNRSEDEARTLKQDIERTGGRCAIFRGDFADGSVAERLIAEAGKTLGPLSLLVNNASVFEEDSIESLSTERWNLQMAINLSAPVFLAKAFAAQAPAGRSSIVNVLDQRVFKPTPLFFSYAVSKAALHSATHMLAQALAPGLRVNGVAPGPTLRSPRQSEYDFANQSARLPLGRNVSADDVARAVLYLASAEGVTGTVIPVDGGQHIAWQTPEISGIRE